MRQSARCPSRRRARRGIGISTAFFRPDFKGGRARSRTCVRGRRWKWTSGIRRVIVHTFRGKTALPCLPIAQPDGPVFGERTRSKAKGEPRRSIDGKMTPWPCVPWLEAVARERASIGIVTTETRPLSSFLLSSEQRKRWREINSPFDRPIHTGSRIVNRQRT